MMMMKSYNFITSVMSSLSLLYMLLLYKVYIRSEKADSAKFRVNSVSCGNGNEMKREKITIHRPSVSKRPYTDIMLWTEGPQLICCCIVLYICEPN